MRFLLERIGAGIRWCFFFGKKKYSKLLYGDDVGPNKMEEDVNSWVAIGVILILAMILNYFSPY